MSKRPTHIDRFEVTRGDLPHWEEPGATYFVRFSLRTPPVVDLTAPQYGQLVVDALRFFDGKRYFLFDYTVMPDHVHMILKPIVREGKTERLSRIMYSLKRWLAQKINEQRGGDGPVWRTESYDHIVRNHEDYAAKAAYILDNPRRAGLVSDPTTWLWWGIGSCGGEDGE